MSDLLDAQRKSLRVAFARMTGAVTAQFDEDGFTI
jgi:hypothetical protein